VETGTGLSLNISEDDNSLSIDLALEVAEYFRLTKSRSDEILNQVRNSVQNWREISRQYGISLMEQDLMSNAFSRAI
jgi:serine/threonine-protein kinase HipA